MKIFWCWPFADLLKRNDMDKCRGVSIFWSIQSNAMDWQKASQRNNSLYFLTSTLWCWLAPTPWYLASWWIVSKNRVSIIASECRYGVYRVLTIVYWISVKTDMAIWQTSIWTGHYRIKNLNCAKPTNCSNRRNHLKLICHWRSRLVRHLPFPPKGVYTL